MHSDWRAADVSIVNSLSCSRFTGRFSAFFYFSPDLARKSHLLIPTLHSNGNIAKSFLANSISRREIYTVLLSRRLAWMSFRVRLDSTFGGTWIHVKWQRELIHSIGSFISTKISLKIFASLYITVKCDPLNTTLIIKFAEYGIVR